MGCSLVGCWLGRRCMFLHLLGELGGRRSQLGPFHPPSALLQTWNSWPLLEEAHPFPSPLLCDLSLRSQVVCVQIFKPAAHLWERMSPFKLKGRGVLHPPPPAQIHTVCVCSVRFSVHHCTQSSRFPDPPCHSSCWAIIHRRLEVSANSR